MEMARGQMASFKSMVQGFLGNGFHIFMGILFVFPGLSKASEPDSPSEYPLPEIVVTATKRVEPDDRIPQLVTLFTESRMEQFQIDDLGDLSFLTPSMEFVDIGHSIESPILMRGVGTYGTGEPSVGYFLDGVYLKAESFRAQPLFDIERVEILKGPQNILYGKSTIGGLINAITREPGFEPEGKLSYEYGEHGGKKWNAVVSGPIVPGKLAGRIALFTEDFDGYYTNAQNHAVDDTRSRDLRLTFLAFPSDTLEIRPLVQVHHQTQGAFPYQKVAHDQDYEGSPFSNNDDNRAETDWVNSSLRISGQWEDTEFISLTGWNQNNEDYGVDADYGPYPMFYMQREMEQNAWSQEFRLHGSLPQSFSYLAGVYFYQLDGHVNTTGLQGGIKGVPVSVFAASTRSRTYSAFGQVTKDLFHTLAVTGGLRYDMDIRKQSEPDMDKRQKYDHLTPTVSLAWRPRENTAIYGSWATGHKPGGFNDGPFPDFSPEKSMSWEFGFKHRPSGSFELKGAIFYTELDDQQLYAIDSALLTDYTLNKGDAGIRGLELEAVTRLNDRWSLRAELSWLNAEYTCYQASRSGPSGMALYDFKGKNLPHVPRYQGLLATSYTSRPQNVWGQTASFFLNLAVKTSGERYWDDFNQTRQEPLQVVDLNAGIKTNRFRIDLFIDNLFDERYFSNYVPGYNFPLGEGSALGVRAGKRQAGINIRAWF